MTKKMTQRERIVKYIAREYDVAPEYLWREYPNFAVFRHPRGRKWFALVMDVSARRLGRGGDEMMDVINIHCPPSMLATILPDGSFMPGYHMNKASWSTIFLNDTLPDESIYPVITASFESVAPRVKPRK